MTTRITAIAATLALILGLASSVLAKGPGSATLEGPGIDEPIEFLNPTEPLNRYEMSASVDMLGLTGLWHGPIPPAIDPPEGDLGPAHTVTWNSWGGAGEPIVQSIYLSAPNGPLIHTPEQDGLASWGRSVIGWFEAREGLESAIGDIVARGQPRDPRPAWVLPFIALAAISGLVGLGRRLSH